MGKNPRNKALYRVRTKDGNSFRTALLMGRSSKKAAKKSNRGRILSVTKVSREELLHIGDYFKLGEQLMKEFKEERRDSEKEKVNITEAPKF